MIRMQPRYNTALAWMFTVFLSFATPARCVAYSVLAHQAIVDSTWETDIRPLLLKRFPNCTPDQLKEAHAYAYGGAIIQDIGYYPHGSKLVSNLTHYVRSGDFIQELLRDSRSLDEYAFALGALSHYAADTEGHSLGVNRSVPLLYSKLARRYGDWVTYEDDPIAHVKTEFGFDVVQVAQGRYAPDQYHQFIGFEVAAPLFEKAFKETYGLDVRELLSNEAKVLGSYRHDVSKIIPKATRIAWSLKKDEIMKDQPGMTRRRFLYNLSRASYQKSWGSNYQTPTPWDVFVAFLLRIIPKIGPLKVLQLRTPTPQTEHIFEGSFNASLDEYRKLLHEAGAGTLRLPNDNLDTGELEQPAKYWLNDETHAKLLDLLARREFQDVSPELRADLLNFFARPDLPYATKRKPKAWAKVQRQLMQLRTTPSL